MDLTEVILFTTIHLFQRRSFGKGASLPLGRQHDSPYLRHRTAALQNLALSESRNIRKPQTQMSIKRHKEMLLVAALYLCAYYSEQWDPHHKAKLSLYLENSEQKCCVHNMKSSFTLAPLTCLTIVKENAPEVYLNLSLCFSQSECFQS